MNGRTAALIFAGVCVVLAILLITGIIGSLTSGLAFAIALVFLGGLSRGFKRD